MKPRGRQVSLSQLRKDLPKWKWSAERHSLGWRYTGSFREEEVVIHATSRLCGPSDDDFETEWRVEDGASSESYYHWIFKMGESEEVK